MDEAALLDARLYREWHATLDPAIHYSAYAHLVRLQGEEVPLGPPLFLENHASLRTRCEQLTTPGLSVSDNPPAPTRHFVTNVRLRPSDAPDTCRVDSYVLVYRTRGTDLPPFSSRRCGRMNSPSRRTRCAFAGGACAATTRSSPAATSVFSVIVG